MVSGEGNYKVSNCQSSGTISVVPENSKGLFDRLYDRDLERVARVLVYVDAESLNKPEDSTMYLAHNLAMDPYFQVRLATNPDAELAEYADVVLSRFDPPVNQGFLDDLEKYDDGSGLFINSPRAQGYFGNKKYLEDIANTHPELLPMTRVISDAEGLKKAQRELSAAGIERVVYKPIQGFGGRNIGDFYLNPQDEEDFEGYSEAIYHLNHSPHFLGGGNEFILQEFIENIESYGDKRIHVVDGVPVGAVLRVPSDGSYKCNITQGASKVKTEITRGDYEIIEKVIPILEDRRVYLAGLDVVGPVVRPYLGEINAVSPGCLVGADQVNGNFHGDGVAKEFTRMLKENVGDLAKFNAKGEGILVFISCRDIFSSTTALIICCACG